MRPSLLTQSDRQPYTYPRSPCEQTWHLAAKIRDAQSPASRFPCLFPSTRRRDSKPTSRRYAALPAHGSASTPAASKPGKGYSSSASASLASSHQVTAHLPPMHASGNPPRGGKQRSPGLLRYPRRARRLAGPSHGGGARGCAECHPVRGRLSLRGCPGAPPGSDA